MGAGERGRRGGRSRGRGRVGGLNRRRRIGGGRRRGRGGRLVINGSGGPLALAICFIMFGVFFIIPGCTLLATGLSDVFDSSGLLIPGIILISLSVVLIIAGIIICIIKRGNNSVEAETGTVTTISRADVNVPVTIENTEHYQYGPMQGQLAMSPGQFYPAPPAEQIPPLDSHGTMYPPPQMGMASQGVYDMAYPPPIQPHSGSQTDGQGKMMYSTAAIDSSSSVPPPPSYDDATRHNVNLQ